MKRILLSGAVIILHTIGLLWIEAFCGAMLVMDAYWSAKDSVALILTAIIYLFIHYIVLWLFKQRDMLCISTIRILSLLDYVCSGVVLLPLLIPNPFLSPTFDIFAFIVSIQITIILCRIVWNRAKGKS